MTVQLPGVHISHTPQQVNHFLQVAKAAMEHMDYSHKRFDNPKLNAQVFQVTPPQAPGKRLALGYNHILNQPPIEPGVKELISGVCHDLVAALDPLLRGHVQPGMLLQRLQLALSGGTGHLVLKFRYYDEKGQMQVKYLDPSTKKISNAGSIMFVRSFEGLTQKHHPWEIEDVWGIIRYGDIMGADDISPWGVGFTQGRRTEGNKNPNLEAMFFRTPSLQTMLTSPFGHSIEFVDGKEITGLPSTFQNIPFREVRLGRKGWDDLHGDIPVVVKHENPISIEEVAEHYEIPRP